MSTALDMLTDSGPVVALLGILAKLAHGMLGGLLAEVKALRGELKTHAAEDSARFQQIKIALQQKWAAQKQ